MSQARPRETRTAAGVALMALAVVFFTCIDSSAKWLAGAGLPVLQVAFARYAGHFLYALAWYAPREGGDAFRSRAPLRQALRSFVLMAGTICNFFALSYLPLTVTTTIFFAGPVLVTLLAIPILGERVGARRLIAVCTGFAGVLVVMQPWGVAWHPAMLFSLASLLCASVYFILTRMLAGTENDAVSQVWPAGLATLALAPLALPVWSWPATPSAWAVFLAIGAFGALGHICANTAHRWADASILAPVVYIQLLLAAAISIVVFGQYPTIWTLLGGLIIIASGLYIWHRERRTPAR